MPPFGADLRDEDLERLQRELSELNHPVSNDVEELFDAKC
jgi:hypothetical protein